MSQAPSGLPVVAHTIGEMSSIQWGDVGTWVGGFGSAAAAMAAATGLWQVRQSRKQELSENRRRTLRYAQRAELTYRIVQTNVGPSHPWGWRVRLTNNTGARMFDVQFGPAYLLIPQSLSPANPAPGVVDQMKIALRHPIAAESNQLPRHDNRIPIQLDPGDSVEFEYLTTKAVVDSGYPYVQVMYSDEDGNSFRSIPADVTQSGTTVHRWLSIDASAVEANGESLFHIDPETYAWDPD